MTSQDTAGRTLPERVRLLERLRLYHRNESPQQAADLIEELLQLIARAEQQIENSYEVSEVGPDNGGFPSKLENYIHQIYKREPKLAASKQARARLVAWAKHRDSCPMIHPERVIDWGRDENGHTIGFRDRTTEDGAPRCNCGLDAALQSEGTA